MSEQAHTRWEVGQHPAVSRGWIVRPVLFGSRVRVLPEHEGGHVLLMDEDDAHLIAAALDLLAVAIKSHEPYEGLSDQDVIDLYGGREAELCLALRAAIARATPSKSGGK